LPGTSIPVATQYTSLNPIPRSGLNIGYEPLIITFIVDEDWRNYIEITNWMRLMGMPTSSDGYKELKLGDLKQPFEMAPEGGLVSDATGFVLTNESTPNLVVFFRDVFPSKLSGLEFRNDVENPEEFVADVTFEYSWFDIEYLGNPIGDE
jgi:hypothetical protein